jgi:hypothetical protein
VSAVDMDLSVLELLDFESDVQCYFPCENTATHALVCFCYARELMCDAHTADVRTWPEDTPVKFDHTCQHFPDIGLCRIEPLDI